MHQVKKNRQPAHWKPGVSGNPDGRPKLPEQLRESRQESAQKILYFLIDHGNMTVAKLTERLNKESTTMLERVVGKMYTKAALGSVAHTNMIIDRLAGVPYKAPYEMQNGQEDIPHLNYSPDVLTAIMIQIRNRAEEERKVLPLGEE